VPLNTPITSGYKPTTNARNNVNAKEINYSTIITKPMEAATPRRDVLTIDGQTYLQMSSQEILMLQQNQQRYPAQQRSATPRWLQNLEYAGVVAGVLSLVHQLVEVGGKVFSSQQRSTINWGEQANKFGQSFAFYITSAFAINTLFDWINSRKTGN
jgi:hypothetical protein